MEIRSWLCCMLFNCVFLQYLLAKSVSLNELIAAESQDKPTIREAPPRLADSSNPPSIDEIVSTESQESLLPIKAFKRNFLGLSKRLNSLTERLSKIRQLKAGNLIFQDKKISPLRYKKKYQIKSPLKPKKLKLASRYRRKSQSIKREINGNESLKHRYIPLLKSVSMLFDKLIYSDESDSYETSTKKFKRNRFHFEEFELPRNTHSGITRSKSQQKATTPASSFSTKISSDTEDLTISEDNDNSTYRSHKSIPILLPRNTFSSRRNNNGTSEGSGTTFDRDTKRYVTRDHGNHENYSRNGQNESCEESNEINTNSYTRSDSSSIGLSGTGSDRNNTCYSEDRQAVNGSSKDAITNDTYGENQFETRRNETESKKFVREPIRRLRGLVSEDEILLNEGLIPKFIRPKEILKESVHKATYNSSNDKRIIDKDFLHTTEDEKIRTRNERVIVKEKNRHDNYSSKSEGIAPVVLIIDGYSVTRDKNGENKVSGKTIHIRS